MRRLLPLTQFLLGVTSFAQNDPEFDPCKEPEKKIDRKKIFLKRRECIRQVTAMIEETLKTEKVPGIVAAVSINGNTVFKKAFGYQDLLNQVQCTTDMKANIGEMSQGFLVYFLGQLIDKGVLCHKNFDVSPWQPKDPKRGPASICDDLFIEPPQVCVIEDDDDLEVSYKFFDLLSHTSGLRDTVPGDLLYQKTPDGDIYKSIKVFISEPLVFRPGDKFHKTSLGCQVLGSLVEHVTKVRYHEFVNSELLKMGLRNTQIMSSKEVVLNSSRIHSPGAFMMSAEWVDFSWRLAGEGIMSNVDDMIKFASMSFMGGIIDVTGKGHRLRFMREALGLNNYGKRPVTEGAFGFLWHLAAQEEPLKDDQNPAFYFSLHSKKESSNSGSLMIRWEPKASIDAPYPATIEEKEFKKKRFHRLLKERGTMVTVVLLSTSDRYDWSLLATDIANIMHKGFQQ